MATGSETGAHRHLLTATGVIEGPVGVIDRELSWGPVTLRGVEAELRFDVLLDVSGHDGAQILDILSRVGPAVEAGVLAVCGAATQAHVSGYTYPTDHGSRRVGAGLRISRTVQVGVDGSAVAESVGRAVLGAVLQGDDERPIELFIAPRRALGGQP